MAKGTEKKRAHRVRRQRAQHETRTQAAAYLDRARWAYQTRQIADCIAYAEKALCIYPIKLPIRAGHVECTCDGRDQALRNLVQVEQRVKS
jgi:hypothetical protein